MQVSKEQKVSVTDATTRRSRPAPLDVQVERIEHRPGGFLRVTLSGESLTAFVWPGPASHLKFFPPSEDQQPEVISIDATPSRRRISRTYTPRSFDALHHFLDIDFLLHGDGVGSDWASKVSPGDRAQVSVPRATYRIDPSALWLLLAGDDSAVPAIGTIIDSGIDLPINVFVETITSELDRPELPEHSLVSITWVNADPTRPGARLEEALRDSSIPKTRGAVWVACEAHAVRRMRRLMLDEHGLAPDTLVTRGYWRQGATNHPDHDFGEDLLEN